jgi:hypothetical protein
MKMGKLDEACAVIAMRAWCAAVSDAHRYKDAIMTAVDETNGVRLILEVGRSWPDNADVQFFLASSIISLTFKTGDQVKTKVAALGGIVLFVDAINRNVHAGHEILTPLIKVVTNLATYDDNCVAILAEGGTAAVCNAMRENVYSPQIQQWACGALKNLTRAPENKMFVAKEGGIQMVVIALKNHPDAEGVQERAMGALQNIASGNNDNKINIAEAGAIENIIKGMKAFPKSAAVAQWGCGSLKCMSANNNKNKKMIQEENGIEACAQALKNFPDSFLVHDEGVVLLANLAGNPDTHKALEENSVAHHIRQSMETFEDKPNIIKYGNMFFTRSTEAGSMESQIEASNENSTMTNV